MRAGSTTINNLISLCRYGKLLLLNDPGIPSSIYLDICLRYGVVIMLLDATHPTENVVTPSAISMRSKTDFAFLV